MEKAKSGSGEWVSDETMLYGGFFFGLWIIYKKACLILAKILASFWGRLSITVITATLLVSVALWSKRWWNRRKASRDREAEILGPGPGSVFMGVTEEGEEVHLKPSQRGMHAEVVGTTNAGKTESTVLPMAIQDIEQGRGLLLIDGKADRSLLDKLWAYTVKAGREEDFRLFSLSHVEESQSFNPLIGGSAEELTERIFNAFEFENPFYRSVQYEVLAQVLRIFEKAEVKPTFLKLHQAISSPQIMEEWMSKVGDPLLQHWLTYFRHLSGSERDQRTAGLTSQIGHFAFGKTSPLLNTEEPSISIEDALANNRIVYFQLPALLSPFLGKATGKLVLQSLQAAVANRHRSGAKEQRFYSVLLDDFSEYLYPGFVTVLNKSRSANVGIVFAHQALGDIKAMGDSVANAILTNSNVKIFMRGNDPDSAEYFSKVVGTKGTVRYTERRKLGWWSEEKSGDVSAREVEEFIIHPNHFKRELGVGQGVMVIPHAGGAKTCRVRFQKYPDLAVEKLIPRTLHKQPIVLKLPVKAKTEENPFVEDLKNHQRKDEV